MASSRLGIAACIERISEVGQDIGFSVAAELLEGGHEVMMGAIERALGEVSTGKAAMSERLHV